MRDARKEKREEVRDDATDSRTLHEIESDEHVPSSQTESSVPSPDEGSERSAEEHDGADF